MKTITIKLYEYDELNNKAKLKAFDDIEYFLRCNPEQYEDENGELKYDDMDKWVSEDIKEYVEDSIRINDYLFFSDGEMAHTVKFCGNHERAGEQILKLGNEEIKIN